MLSIRKTWLAPLALALLACAAVPVYAAPAPPARVTRLDPAKLMPADTEMVLVVNARQLLDSPLVKKHALEPFKSLLEHNEQARKALAAAGLDPLKDVDGLMLATSGGLTKGKMVVFVRGRFDLDKVHKIAAEHAEKKPGELKLSKEGAVQLYEIKAEDKPVFAAFADRTTLVVSSSKDYTLEQVKNFGKRKAAVNKEMQAALDKVSPRAGLWMAAVITAEMKKMMAASPQTSDIAPKLEYVVGGVEVGTDAELNVRIQTSDAKVATDISRKINDLKVLAPLFVKADDKGGQLVSDLVDTLKVGTDEGAVRISLKFTEAMVEKAKKIK